MEKWLQNTMGLVFKIFPVAADLNLFPTGESLLREVSRQVTECFANSVCNYSTEENIPLRDALLINFLFGTDAESEMQEFDAKDIPLANEGRVAAAARFDIYVEDRSGSVQMLADYQKNAYRPGSAKKFMDILVRHLTVLVSGQDV